MPQGISLEDAVKKYQFTQELIMLWVLLGEIHLIPSEKPVEDLMEFFEGKDTGKGKDIILNEEALQDFLSRRGEGEVLEYISRLEQRCLEDNVLHIQSFNKYLNLYNDYKKACEKNELLRKGTELAVNTAESLYAVVDAQKEQTLALQKDITLLTTTCPSCWMKKICRKLGFRNRLTDK